MSYFLLAVGPRPRSLLSPSSEGMAWFPSLFGAGRQCWTRIFTLRVQPACGIRSFERLFGGEQPRIRCFSVLSYYEQVRAKASITAFIDGDSGGKEVVGNFIEQLRQQGYVKDVYFFAEPERLTSKGWKPFLQKKEIQFKPVARTTDVGDPNDAAMFMEIRRMLDLPSCTSIALLIQDADFLPLIQQIVSSGKRCIVSTCMERPGLEKQARALGAEVIEYADAFKNGLPKYVCILHADGSGSVGKKTPDLGELSEKDDEDLELVCSKLQAMSYRQNARDPVIPAIARFAFQNRLGDLIVYPNRLAVRHVAEFFRDARQVSWTHGRGDLAFVFPHMRTSDTNGVRNKYGNKACAMLARGGGPFVLRDSGSLVEEILHRMNYIDSFLNTDFDEALQVFMSLTYNRRELRKSGYTEQFTTKGRVDTLRRLSLSSCCHGYFQMPPSDENVRRYLVSKGDLEEGASLEDLFDSMAHFILCQGSSGSPKRTYHARVLQCLDIFASRLSHPSRRK